MNQAATNSGAGQFFCSLPSPRCQLQGLCIPISQKRFYFTYLGDSGICKDIVSSHISPLAYQVIFVKRQECEKNIPQVSSRKCLYTLQKIDKIVVFCFNCFVPNAYFPEYIFLSTSLFCQDGLSGSSDSPIKPSWQELVVLL